MPAPQIYTAGDTQDHLAALLLADNLFAKAFPNVTKIWRSDPGSVSNAEGVKVALDVATEGVGPGGAVGDVGTGGADEQRVTLVLLIYVFAMQRDETLKRQCVDQTAYARAAVNRYRADKTPGLQLWQSMTFGAPGRADASAYIWQPAYYLSITPINLLSLNTRR